jgi:tagatose-6-phosphate ketose/aldose isomerase
MTKYSKRLILDTHHTWSEISQQPQIWPTTLRRVSAAVENLQLDSILSQSRVLLTGAGSSAYAASAIAPAWHRAIAVPSTDLLIDTERYIAEVDMVISIGRSGNSPESIASVKRIHKLRPRITHLAITCNSDGLLAQSPLVRSIVLDPRTNDKSLVMTSSFSNLVLAGLSLANKSDVESVVPTASSDAHLHFDTINQCTSRIAGVVKDRIVFLCSSPLFSWAQEAALKVLEMTAGKFSTLAETYLGLRHGPMSFLRPDTLILCLLSNDLLRRRYEQDLIEELRTKNIGYLVGVGATQDEANFFEEVIPAVLPKGADALRTPFEIIGPQLLGYHMSLRAGLNPDNPSPDGVINRVVQGVKIHEDSGK